MALCVFLFFVVVVVKSLECKSAMNIVKKSKRRLRFSLRLSIEIYRVFFFLHDEKLIIIDQSVQALRLDFILLLFLP